MALIQFWTWLFAKLGGRNWQRQAAAHGVGKGKLFDRPYEKK